MKILFYVVYFTREYWWIGLVVLGLLFVGLLTGTIKRHKLKSGLKDIDIMNGHDFEHYAAQILENNGYKRVQVTPASGDYGADIICYKDGKKYAIQCKRYNADISNSAVQEVYAAKAHYRTDKAVVLTNRYFRPSAVKQAKSAGVLLWDRDELQRLLSRGRKREKHAVPKRSKSRAE